MAQENSSEPLALIARDQKCEKWAKWIKCTSPELLIKEASSQKGFKLALKFIESAHPVLVKFGCGMIADVGEVPCFLQVSTVGKSFGTSLVVAEEKTEADIHHLQCHGDDAKNLAAAFIMDFEDANFLYQENSQEMPKRMFLLVPSSINPQKMDQYVMCLSNLKNLVIEGLNSFHVGCSQ